MNADRKADQAVEIINRILPLLHGQDPQVVGAVLADLTAMWVAGHVSPGNPEETKQVREAMLTRHIVGVMSLIDVGPGRGPGGGVDEFDCVECGRHIISIGNPSGNCRCGACISIPGWHLDPELRQQIDPDYAEERAGNPNLQTPKSGL